MEPTLLNEIQSVLHEAVIAAGKRSLEFFGRVEAEYKQSATGPEQFSLADRAVQDLLIERIRSRFPSHGIIAEEPPDASEGILNLPPKPDAEPLWWVIDPIDGTNNFINGLGYYCVSVGVLGPAGPLAAAVYEPNREVLYHAVAGGGAFLGATPLHARPQAFHQDAFIGIESLYAGGIPPFLADWMTRLRTRNLGSAALHLCLVASGVFHACFCLKPKVWDWAAGGLIVREAGGTFSRPDGSDPFDLDLSGYRGKITPYLAANPDVYPEVQQAIGKHFE